MRESRELKNLRNDWIGQRVQYILLDATQKGEIYEGPFVGIVVGVTDNGAAVEGGAEGHTLNTPVSPTGHLIVVSDERTEDDWPRVEHCTKI